MPWAQVVSVCLPLRVFLSLARLSGLGIVPLPSPKIGERMSENISRIIGAYSSGRPGPLLFVIGGIHGNEPAGVSALKRVFDTLDEYSPEIDGTIIGVRGNMQALRQRKRFIDRDLNRLWSDEHASAALAKAPADRAQEENELLELMALVEQYMDGSHTREILVDLHTTSAPGGLFAIINNSAADRQLASALHAPIIFGLTHALACTTNVFAEARNLEMVAFESGQHDDPAAVDNHEAAVWLLLEKAGCLNASLIPDFSEFHRRLIRASKDIPRYLEVVHRHEIVPADAFNMHPGFSNFHQVYQDEPLARDARGEVLCPYSGLMLMPLYQPQGEEGFFIVKPLDAPPV